MNTFIIMCQEYVTHQPLHKITFTWVTLMYNECWYLNSVSSSNLSFGLHSLQVLVFLFFYFMFLVLVMSKKYIYSETYGETTSNFNY